ncbi:DNA repair protein RecN [Methylovirgula sp. 4M-Z18]|uniref:DNA repair protein RecN n=1 Tax=Methylovirgula sp. 4M-Z18 TaxID=2293567 RepID=UPI000E2FC6A7|nr:DNA repair protein RecN [Methylovirgula sp. 4M-Z18]RFB79601.1 DNA repair protein RecN [Methylovirgula sp. 4M-Z18]
MLAQLAIRDIVLIDKLDLEIGAGLTVLTGETGAGKSILLDAFALALGGRGDGSLVRHGQAQGQVTAVFDLAMDHPARQLAMAQNLDVDGDLILRRMQMADGRTRAFVNDQPLSAQSLRQIGRALVEIHGQHDDRALIDPATHRELVDTFGGLIPQVEALRAAYDDWRAAEAERDAEQARVDAARAEADFLRHAHAELTKLAPQPGEEEQLAVRRTAMMQAEKVAGELNEAFESIAGDHGPLANLASVLRRLERRATQAPHLIEPSAKALSAALDALNDAQATLEQALRDADFDPRELERTEERLFALRGAARKYQVTIEALPALAEKFAGDLAALDAGEARLVKLAQKVAESQAAYDKAARTLSAGRAKAAKQIDKAVNAELPPLKLERAQFLTQVASDGAPTREGIDRVEFWVQTNPGTKPGPLMKVASGGELARFMLALKVVLADRGSAPTLVFDEIDTGVGGAVADAIGQRLARLAGRVQVLAVTHAPQVAAKAHAHMRIAKADIGKKGERVATSVATLHDEARREEIARMLAGATITNEARAAAARLIEGAA